MLGTPAEMGHLQIVTYSLTFDDRRLLREMGLKFSKAAIKFSANDDRLIIKRGRVCTPGVCLDDEVCCDASQVSLWKHFLQAPVARIDHISPSEQHGQACRLTFAHPTANRTSVEIFAHGKYLRILDENGVGK